MLFIGIGQIVQITPVFFVKNDGLQKLLICVYNTDGYVCPIILTACPALHHRDLFRKAGHSINKEENIFPETQGAAALETCRNAVRDAAASASRRRPVVQSR